IYIPELTFPQSGKWDVSLVIGPGGKDHIINLPLFEVYGSHEEADRAPLPHEIGGISFLKEQQWEIPTSTEPVRKRKVLDSEVLAVPESTLVLVDEDGLPMVFVQVAGETFQKRCLTIGGRANGFVQVLSGLSEGEYVTTKGAYAVARAEHGEESTVHLSDEQIRRFGIETSPAGPGDFKVHISLPGQIAINTDRMVHIVPRVPGIVRQVNKKLGDTVTKGQVMAVIESRDLADAKATYLASIERLDLANTIYEREEILWKQEISSKQEYLDAKKASAEAKIAKRTESAEMLTTFEITAPFDGTVIKKHITLGEVTKGDVDVFIVADLDTVWVDLQVHQKYAALIKKGQDVIISATSSVPETKGVIDYVEPVVDKNTRTALARIILDNTSGQLRPGTFITADVLVEKVPAKVTVAKDILQDIDDKICIFVKNEHCFEARPVTVGRSNDSHVEIVSGIRPGEKIVTKNSFRLKAELEKGAGSGHAGHGHAH
ncbi:MAG: efflux RND transporter periplasmic adaptor subunit, partial [Planctomycetota bacterium]